MSAAPSLSVIVVCKNPGPRLAATLDSLWTQRHVAPDLVVIDGGSTDGTRAWLEARRDRLGTLVSEPDGGVYDAMNKGVAAARGDWVLFLGADDRLVGDMVLSEALNWLKKTDVNPLARNFVHHQAAFYRRALFAENGGFDPALTIMGDYDFNLRLWKNRVRFKPIPLRIAACGVRGLSDAGRWRGYREEITVRHRYFAAWRCWLWDALSVARCLRKQVL
jgi:glycosyltransferase involved in cell wall biosynthesis